MWDPVFLALILACAGIISICLIYICYLWWATNFNSNLLEHYHGATSKSMKAKGLSAADLEKLPRITGKDLGLTVECAVCIDDIGSDEPVRLIPGCNHGFHLRCADTWLSKHSICPVCRAKLPPEVFNFPKSSRW